MSTHTHQETRVDLLNWIDVERMRYADGKYTDDKRTFLIEALKTEGLSPTWMNFHLNYLKRADLFGLDTTQGRQAMAKCIVSLMHCLETAIEEFGPLPAPGVPSGEIQ